MDVSTIKELAVHWAPAVVDAAPRKATNHRALDDIRESVAELRWYRDHLFRTSTASTDPNGPSDPTGPTGSADPAGATPTSA